ncbi:MAG: hypothetical protein IIC33_06545 [Chloroflexi bacterium]|nr:hypothetical protein [Chloroflexota bacterium]
MGLGQRVVGASARLAGADVYPQGLKGMGVALSLCARPLEARILRLLAKGPSDRPESAKEVLTELEAVDLQEVSPESGPTQESGQVLDRLAGGVFVGRQRELSELKASLDD